MADAVKRSASKALVELIPHLRGPAGVRPRGSGQHVRSGSQRRPVLVMAVPGGATDQVEVRFPVLIPGSDAARHAIAVLVQCARRDVLEVPR